MFFYGQPKSWIYNFFSKNYFPSLTDKYLFSHEFVSSNLGYYEKKITSFSPKSKLHIFPRITFEKGRFYSNERTQQKCTVQWLTFFLSLFFYGLMYSIIIETEASEQSLPWDWEPIRLTRSQARRVNPVKFHLPCSAGTGPSAAAAAVGSEGPFWRRSLACSEVQRSTRPDMAETKRFRIQSDEMKKKIRFCDLGSRGRWGFEFIRIKIWICVLPKLWNLVGFRL